MAAMEANSFGARLRRLRLAAGLTQEALAERAGISARAVGELERQPDRLPRLDSAVMLADALGLDKAEHARFLAAARPALTDAKAPARPARSPGSLPKPLTPIVGREEMANTVVALLQRDEGRLLTLTGPGGVGKTRLAIEVALRAADTFRDGAIFVDLAPLRDSALLLRTIAQRLGLDERDATPLDERLSALVGEKQLLLVLDNLEHLVAAWGDLLALVESCPRLVVLATSRVALRVRGEREYRVAPLALPPASAPLAALVKASPVVLFVQRAQAVGATLTLDAAMAEVVTQICRRLDGLPLAIELAAAWTRLLPPPALLVRLERRLPLLVAGAHDLPDRQRTMRDTITWSYDLLTPAQQRLFRWLSVFSGGCTPEAVEAVCEGVADDVAIVVGLAALVDRSLLRSETADDAEPRLLMLETLREYGLERLSEHGEMGMARDRHAAYYLALAEAAGSALLGPEGPIRLARLEQDHDNLRAALGWSLEQGERERALRFAGALWRFWLARGHLSEGSQSLRAALALLTDTVGPPSVALRKALLGAALLSMEQGRYAEAADFCTQAVAQARAQGAGADLVEALNAQGRLRREQYQYDEATRCHREARALAQALGDRAGEGAALTGLAYAATFAGDVAQGQRLAEQGLALIRAGQDRYALAEALIGASAQAQHAGESVRAEMLASEALALFRDLGDTGRMAEALFSLGVAAHFQGHHARAVQHHEEGLALRRERGDQHGAVQPLTALALLALEQDDRQRARALLEESLAILQRFDDRWARAMSLAILGHVALAENEPLRAQQFLTEALALLREIDTPLYLPWCLEGLAGVAAVRGAWERAAHLCGARDALREQLGFPLPPAHPDGYARTLTSIRAALGAAAFDTAHERGQALTVDAIADMTDDDEPAGGDR